MNSNVMESIISSKADRKKGLVPSGAEKLSVRGKYGKNGEIEQNSR